MEYVGLNCNALRLSIYINPVLQRASLSDRPRQVLDEVSASEGKIILFIDEIHTVIGAGQAGDSKMDAGNLLKPRLARGELRARSQCRFAQPLIRFIPNSLREWVPLILKRQCDRTLGELHMVGATTLDEYKLHIEKDAAFERRLQVRR